MGVDILGVDIMGVDVMAPILIGILLEEVTVLYFASLLWRGQLLKERICSLRSKFFPLRVDPISKELFSSREPNKNTCKLI